MRKFYILLILFYIPFVYAEDRLADWAKPVHIDGLKNIYSLSDTVYRSEQPDEISFKKLEKFGMKEVLNLRQFHSDEDEAEKTSLKLHHVKMNAAKVNSEQLLKALKIIKNAKGPILFHCWHGSDRTGLVAASYRIIFQNWPKYKAIEELIHGGYGYHSKIYTNIVRQLESLDVEWYKFELRLK